MNVFDLDERDYRDDGLDMRTVEEIDADADVVAALAWELVDR